MAEAADVMLLVEDKVFKTNKALLCEYSDYFRAMFSGNYIEKEKNKIRISVVSSGAMKIILEYMGRGFIDLKMYSMDELSELAESANFLQITELTKQIEYKLGYCLALNNWADTMTVAEKGSFPKLVEKVATYALYSFKEMKPEHIGSIQKLGWYLSHPYLRADTEIEVFEFGFEWVTLKQTGADSLLYILGCLDMDKINKWELNTMKRLMKRHENSLAEKIIDCLHYIVTTYKISAREIKKNKTAICEMFTERVYKEVLDLVTHSIKRLLEYKPFVTLNFTSEDPYTPTNPHCVYSFDGNGFNKWVEVAEKNLWGWIVVPWGLTKLVVASGEHGRGTGSFWRGVNIYDLITNEWDHQRVQLPIRRHCGAVILGNEIFLVGGVASGDCAPSRLSFTPYLVPEPSRSSRVTLNSASAYDLNLRGLRSLARFPDYVQSPSLCAHKGHVYCAGHKNIYRFYDGDKEDWHLMVETNIRPANLVSFKGHIYCSQNYFNHFYRFRPDVDSKLELVTCFSTPPAAIISLGNKLVAFTNASGTQAEMITVEEYEYGSMPKVVWTEKTDQYSINAVAGAGVVVNTAPPVKPDLSPYLRRHLASYGAFYTVRV
ncbi:kelch-like protein 15 isoform X2 [Anticarsia gemmatalis]|uniref:kelch-like protein 15 isoform X2 n=1 Tax=Anticarsia gemmatalis TaxID=129554 RepID=UPI003F75EEBE